MNPTSPHPTTDPQAETISAIHDSPTRAALAITGGGSGLGAAMAIEFARRGVHVAVSGRRVDRLSQVVKEIEAAGGRLLDLVEQQERVSETSKSSRPANGESTSFEQLVGRHDAAHFASAHGRLW